jgi:hypothetical protein
MYHWGRGGWEQVRCKFTMYRWGRGGIQNRSETHVLKITHVLSVLYGVWPLEGVATRNRFARIKITKGTLIVTKDKKYIV